MRAVIARASAQEVSEITPLTPNPFPPRKRRERGDPVVADGRGNLRLSSAVLEALVVQRNFLAPFPSACVGERAGDRGALWAIPAPMSISLAGPPTTKNTGSKTMCAP